MSYSSSLRHSSVDFCPSGFIVDFYMLLTVIKKFPEPITCINNREYTVMFSFFLTDIVFSSVYSKAMLNSISRSRTHFFMSFVASYTGCRLVMMRADVECQNVGHDIFHYFYENRCKNIGRWSLLRIGKLGPLPLFSKLLE